MRILLWGALASAGAMNANAPARADEGGGADSALAAVRALSSDVYTVGREADRARNSPAAALDARIVELRNRVGAIRRAAHMGDGDASVVARKLRNVSFLLGNIERARKPGSSTALSPLVPEHLARSLRSTFAKLDARHGADCTTALGLGIGGEVDGVLEAGADAWLHIETDATRIIRIDTRASALDTEIVVFDGCPAHGGARISSSDDAFGLAAAVALQPDPHRRSRWLRVRNLGARGELSVIAGETGTIEGTINWVHPLPSALEPYAIALDATGSYVGSSYSVATHYGLALDPGNYYILAFADGNVGQIWPNIECSNTFTNDCPRDLAQAVPVTASVTTSGIDFSLNEGARISGRVRDADGVAIPSATIIVQNEVTGPSFSTYSDSAGRFAVKALAAGTYRISASSPRHMAQAFDGIDCPTVQSCLPDFGTPITLARQGAFDRANFALHPAAFVRAAVHATAAPFESAYVTAYDAAGNPVASNVGYPGQTLELGPLTPGTYRFSASMSYQMAQLYDHIDCAYDCQAELPTATPVAVAGGAPTTIAFDLTPLASLRGRVTDASGAGLANATLEVWSTLGGGGGTANVDADGNYKFRGLYPGTYWLVASSPDHRDVVYPYATCDDTLPGLVFACDTANALPIAIGTTDVAGVDFALLANGAISGQAHLADAGQGDGSPVPIWLYDASGNIRSLAWTDSSGAYSIVDLPAGSYFAEASGGSLFAQVYSGIDCPIAGVSCDATAGTPIPLAQGAQRTDIDFSVVDSHSLVGRVTDAVTGNGIAGVVIDAWDPSSGLHCDDASTDLLGYYSLIDSATCSAPTRLLSTDAGLPHADQVFDGIPCPYGSAYSGACSLAGATAVAFPTMPVPTRTDFVLGARDPDVIFASGFDPLVARAARTRR
jgi:hypothetical protein